MEYGVRITECYCIGRREECATTSTTISISSWMADPPGRIRMHVPLTSSCIGWC